MNQIYSKNKLSYFQENIIYWFEHNQRAFPWREPFLTTYQLIISEVLLQRTKAETVSKFYTSFITEFPNWESLSTASLENIEGFLKPLGLQRQRAKRLQALSMWMVKHNGELPTERTTLNNIPFMGQYIANAVELLVYHKNMPLLDVNMARVLERFFGNRKLADIRYDPYLQNLAYEVVQHQPSKEISWAILDFAAVVCKARRPRCEICLISSDCTFYQTEIRLKR